MTASLQVPPVDVTGERDIASQNAFGVSDRSALGPRRTVRPDHLTNHCLPAAPAILVTADAAKRHRPHFTSAEGRERSSRSAPSRGYTRTGRRAACYR